MTDRSITFDDGLVQPPPPKDPSLVRLEISKWGRPIIYIAEWFYQCIPGVAVTHISSQCAFSTRREAIRWAKFTLSLHAGFDWTKWRPNEGDAKQIDLPDREYTFAAYMEDITANGKYSHKVSVRRTEICGKFDWAAGGDANLRARGIE